MKAFAAALARRIWPETATLPAEQREALLSEVRAILLSIPLVLAAGAWLASATDFAAVRGLTPFLLLLTGLNVLAGRISYFQIIGRRAGEYGYNSSDLENVITASAVLIVGVPAIWVHLAARTIYFLTTWPQERVPALSANWVRNLLFNLWAGTVSLLPAFLVYRAAGGLLPLPDLSLRAVTPAVVFVLVEFVLGGLTLWFLLWFMGAMRSAERRQKVAAQRGRVLRFFMVAGFPSIFGILGAALFSQLGLPGYLFFVAAVLLTSFLARRQSQAAVLNQQRARQLAKLEELGRALIKIPAEDEALSQTLRQYVPRMFDYDQADVTLFDGRVLLRVPSDDAPRDRRLWRWLEGEVEPAAYVRGEILPWSGKASSENLLLAPIRHIESNEPLGGICLRSRGRITTLGFRESLPSLQVLAAQIASVLHRREALQKRLALERMTQELALARQMQVSFLPQDVPQIHGWELQASLSPARQTSGDFYDLIHVAPDALGVLVADVADKGMSAALFMAVSRTLLRTYAYDYPYDPARVLASANLRILSDTSDDAFVTVFYGVLNLESGVFIYANAGHNPGYLLSREHRRLLSNTGIPLGIQRRARWETKRVEIAPDDLLLLYTDGVTDAHDSNDELFGVDRLLSVVDRGRHEPLPELTASVTDAVNAFCGERPQFDDVTLLLARRLSHVSANVEGATNGPGQGQLDETTP